MAVHIVHDIDEADPPFRKDHFRAVLKKNRIRSADDAEIKRRFFASFGSSVIGILFTPVKVASFPRSQCRDDIAEI